ncbi:MAG: hypothetical protein R2991_14425 [Thermoanaerobaculia bacterium]
MRPTDRRNLVIAALAICLLMPFAVQARPGDSDGADGGRPSATYMGVQHAVRFDVSPPLRDIARLLPLPLQFEAEIADEGDTGLEGPYGPQDADAAVQGAVGEGTLPPPDVSFDGPISVGFTPPDSVGDVGPNHYVAMSNVTSTIHNKTGTIVMGPFNNNSLWSGFGGDCETNNSGDPVVLYDQLADRWLLSQFTSSGPTFFNCVALSTTGDPTGTYFRWAFPTDTPTNFPDYPKYGVWPEAYLLATREFSAAGPFAGVGAYALNRVEMLAGNPSPQVIAFLATPAGVGIANIGDGLLPSDLDGTNPPPGGSPGVFVGSMDNGGPYGASQDALTIWEFDFDFSNPPASSFTLVDTLPVAAFDSIFPCSPGSRDCIPQPGTTVKVDHQGYRQRVIHRLAYRNFGDHQSMVTNQSVEVPTAISGVRWYELRNTGGGWSVHQQGTYAPGTGDGIDRWFGSIAMDASGNMGLGFSASDDTATFPSVWYTGRLAGDPLGTLPQGEDSIIDGGGSQLSSGHRWGDYSSMNIDPVDDCTFWFVSEYYPVTASSSWRMRIGSFRFPSCMSDFLFGDGFETGDTSAWDQTAN